LGSQKGWRVLEVIGKGLDTLVVLGTEEAVFESCVVFGN
jgi:hypothetical protein